MTKILLLILSVPPSQCNRYSASVQIYKLFYAIRNIFLIKNGFGSLEMYLNDLEMSNCETEVTDLMIVISCFLWQYKVSLMIDLTKFVWNLVLVRWNWINVWLTEKTMKWLRDEKMLENTDTTILDYHTYGRTKTKKKYMSCTILRYSFPFFKNKRIRKNYKRNYVFTLTYFVQKPGRS